MTDEEVQQLVEKAKLHIHQMPKCEHEFGGWRDFDDNSGGEQFCQKCGMGAMQYDAWWSE